MEAAIHPFLPYAYVSGFTRYYKHPLCACFGGVTERVVFT